MKIFVAGSKSQYDEVMEIVKRIGNESEVNYVTPGDITAEHMVHSVYQKISAVSYTHLDVYKRQVMAFMNRQSVMHMKLACR